MNNFQLSLIASAVRGKTGMKPLARSVLLSVLSGAWPHAMAQNWPSKPVKFVMTAPAGSSIDAIGRILADKIKGTLRQPVIVENRAGAGGTLATDFVAKSVPDGYTLVLSFNGPLAFGPHLYAKLPYDPFKDLMPVVTTTSQPNVLAVSAAVPAISLKELIAHAKANPGRLSYASVGNGSSSHLSMELLKRMAGLDIVHVPFNGSPPAIASVAGNDTQLLFAVPTAITPLAKAGKVRLLAVSGAGRYTLTPELPTLAEAGLPKFEALAWNGVLAPAGTPAEIVARLNREFNAALKDAEVRARLNAAGLEPVGGTAEAFRQLIQSESDKWGPIIRRIGVRVD
ncbi:MAG TPA: tripartite tricarboxylate transporter substrate binding protein [Burkholderiales bacterium]|nr:tripartite tricarboxylate transporter substrate binding protein [Burkholderiales bacterium]